MTSFRDLKSFIQSARKKGYSDIQIRKVLLEYKWSEKIIQKAFEALNPKSKIKNQICIYLNDEMRGVLRERANKNLFTLQEQIENILRRSCARKLKKQSTIKIDDFLISCFSKSSRGRKKRK